MFRTVPVSIIRSFSLHTAVVYVIQVLLTACGQGSGRNCSCVLILLASCNCKLYDIYHCCVYSEKLLMMDRGTIQNM